MRRGTNNFPWSTSDLGRGILNFRWGIFNVRKGTDNLQRGTDDVRWGVDDVRQGSGERDAAAGSDPQEARDQRP